MNLLLVEDDESFGYIMKSYLEMHDFRVHWIKQGDEALSLIRECPFDLCILDVMLPGMDGFEIARNISVEYPNLPFIFLTAKSLKVDKLKGYKLGGDDYITKPVDEELLIAKINAILKRSVPKTNGREGLSVVWIGSYEFDYDSHRLSRQGRERILTDIEARLLKMLFESHHQLVSRERALKDIWGKNDPFNRKTMDVFIYKLRKYLRADPEVRIRNVHGKGFILEWKREGGSAS